MNNHKLGELKQQKYILSQFWKKTEIKLLVVLVLSKDSKENLFYAPLPAFGRCRQFSVSWFWTCITPVSACASRCLTLCVCVSNLPLPFSLWYLSLDLALTLNLGWSHFKIFMCAKTLCPNKTTFRVSEGLGCRHILGGALFTTVVLDGCPFPSNAWSKKKKKKKEVRGLERVVWAGDFR